MFWRKCLSFTKLLSMTYAKQNIQAAGSACSRLRVTWHGQKLAHHLRGNLRARWVFQDSFHDDWRHETKKLGSRCHYAFAQGVPLRLALSPLGCGFERAKRAHPKSWGEKVRKWESENWRFRLWVDLFGRIRFPVLAGRVDSNTQQLFSQHWHVSFQQCNPDLLSIDYL